MPISFGGLASGIDTGALVDTLVGVAKQPIDQLDRKRSLLDGASQTISGIASKLSALKSAALALSTSTGFSSFAAASSDTAVVASATGAASVATYSVQVSALARSQKTRSSVVASASSPLGQAGSLDITVGAGAAKNVSILATDTLTDVANKISASGARVTASVFNDGTGFRLLVQGLDTGAENAFTVAENSTTFGFAAPGATYETAQDASLTVDGMPVTSKTNQVTGVIAGVKLALTKTTASAATVSVTSDTAALKTKVTAFVNAYNEFVNAGHAAAGFGATKATNAELAADSTIRTALRRVGSLLSSAVPGATGAYTTFMSVGVTAKRDGTLTLDATRFDAAMAADPDGVRKLFVTDATVGATGAMKGLMSTIDGLVTGTSAPLQARADRLSAQSKRLADSKVKMEQRLEDYRAQLQKQFLAMDQAVSKYQAMSASVTSSIKSVTGAGSGSE